MELEFDRGSRSHPSGHALVYFRDADDSDTIGVTYVVILPVPLDLSKYMPPFLATQVAEMTSETISSFAFPPAPEPVDGYDELMKLAELRGDDVVYAGSHSFTDAFGLMEKVSEATSRYSDVYAEAHVGSGDAHVLDVRVADDDDDDDDDDEEEDKYFSSDAEMAVRALDDEQTDVVDDLVYGSMAEADLLTELTSLLGRMRYAVDGGDATTAAESRSKIQAIGRYLPDNRKVSSLIAAASERTEQASQLAQLYLERAYCLYREDYLRLKKIEEDIADINGAE